MVQSAQSSSLPVVPMRNAVLFPGVTFPISAGRAGTLRGIEAAMSTPERLVFAVAQRSDSETVSPTELYTIGTIATLGSIQRGIGGIRLVLEGKSRGIALRVAPKNGYLEATVQHAQEMLPLDSRDPAFAGLHREARERAAELGRKLGLPDETVDQILAEVDEPGRLADLVAGYLDIPVADKQALLETLSVEDRLRRVLVHVQRQVDVISAQEDIQSKVKEELGGRQREMYLREQMKAIQKELGEGEGGSDDGLKELRAKLDALDLPEDARKEVDREWARLTRIGRESMESQVLRTYLETIAELPWNARTDEKLDVGEAAQRARRRPLRVEGRQGPDPRVPRRAAARARAGRRGAGARRGRAEGRRRPKPTRRTRPPRPSARARAASSSSPDLRASARPRSPSPSPARWAASTSASRSAARATRPTSAATGAPTSARCRGASSRA